MAIAVPQTPLELGLPYSAWRKGQDRIIERIVNSDKKFSIMQAPTGTGKTLIAMGLASMQDKQARSLLLCKTKQLQSQYTENFPSIHTVKGRANFGCKVFPGLSADTAPCSFVQSMEDKKECAACDYIKQRDLARSERVVSANYSYYLYSWKYTAGLGNFDLAVCDEAHLLENELSRFGSVTLNKRALSANRIKFYNTESLDAWKSWAQMSEQVVDWEAERLEAQVLGSMQAGEEPDQGTLHLAKWYRGLSSNLRSISQMNGLWVVTDNPKWVKFQPIWLQEGAGKVFEKVSKVVLMSATVLEPRMFADLLGIAESDYDFYDLPCQFPKANRPIYFIPAGYMSYKRMDAELPKLTKAIDGILDSHANHKGVIHTHNYRITEHLLKNSTHAQHMLTHTVENREEVLAQFKRAAPPAILVSPSMGTGVSLDDDLARYAIVAKLPFPDQSDKVVSGRLSSDGKTEWYSYATAAEMIQSTGRIVRSPSDWGSTYILDANFGWFLKQNKNLFPQWWLDAVEIKKA